MPPSFKTQKTILILMKFLKLLIAFFILCSPALSKDTGFTQEDRERLIRLETTLKVFMEQTDKRFTELREDMNKRFEQVNNELNRLVNIMVGIFAGQIALVVAVIGFAWWDREKAKTDKELAEILKQYGLM
ncbi:MAG: hypothetical protein GXO18_01245 [Aquificae bacterium]|nr:hypothetical protein [Aquificota bacterium]